MDTLSLHDALPIFSRVVDMPIYKTIDNNQI